MASGEDWAGEESHFRDFTFLGVYETRLPPQGAAIVGHDEINAFNAERYG
ncbi:MAG: hypothetical protein GWP08_04740 [Nitrospiraceae bacterium]|nr:hypothetical protein [Nitrospiraceae bacterium]